MATATINRASSGCTGSRWDVDDVLVELRHRRFALDRCLYVAYTVDTGQRRDAAFELRQRVADDGWQSSLYADGSGFVVRFGRSERVTRELLAAEQRYLDSLAEAYGATIRAVSVEDLDRADLWARLAARQSGEYLPTAVVSAPPGTELRPAPIPAPAAASIA